MKTKKEKKINLSGSFQYTGVDFDYQTYHPCSHGDSCCDNDYCRCGRIIDIKITKISINEIIDYLCGDVASFSMLDKYIIDRVLTYYKVYDPNSWEVKVSGGYYGQEVDGVFLLNPLEPQEEINKMLNYSTTHEKLEHLLKLEYKFCKKLPEKWTEFTVKFEDLEFANENHFIKINNQESWYKNYPHYHALTIKLPNGKFRIIDGYHRIKSNLDKNLKILSCEYADLERSRCEK